MPSPVIEAIQTHIALESMVGGYEAAEIAAAAVACTYDALATLLGCERRNVAILESATAAMAQALSAFDFHSGDRVVTTNADYGSNQLMLLSLRQRCGIEVARAADLPEGGADPDSIRTLLQDGRCRLVVMTWVPTNSGLIQPVVAVSRLCADYDVPLLVDACQAAGQLPINVDVLGCAFLVGTARKFLRGPRGIGFLYVSDRALSGAHPLFPDVRGARWIEADQFELQSTAMRFEHWEFPYALLLGLGAACRYALAVGVGAGGLRARALAAYAREKLGDLDGVRLLDRGRDLAAIATLSVGQAGVGDLLVWLRKRQINTGISIREHAIIDMDAKGVRDSLRISPHYYNTTSEVDQLVMALEEVLSGR